MPRSPDQLGHSVSASPPDHIEPLLTEAPSQVLLRTPYLLYLHSRTFTGKIPLSFPSKCLCPHTPSRFSSVLFQAIPLPSSLTLLPVALRLTSLTPPRVLAFLLRSPFLFPTASVFNKYLSTPSPPNLYQCGRHSLHGTGRHSLQGTGHQTSVSDNHVHTRLSNPCAHNGPTSEPNS